MDIKPFKLERYFSLYEHKAKYSICNSDCEAMSITDLLSLEKGAQDKFQNTWLGYTHTKGSESLRCDISSIYNKVSSDDLIVCSGAQEPIFLFSQAMLSPGDEVIVQSPCYQSLQSVPESIGCKVLKWGVKYNGKAPSFDIDELRNMISSKTKVIFLNSPHNPTGFHFTKDEQTEIIDIARRHNILIFCDEVYRELESSREYALPAIADVYESGTSIGVMSKSYGLPGLRIGWIASQNQGILDKVAELKEYTTICNSAPSEFLAGVALRNRKQILDKNLNIVRHNLSTFREFFKEYKELFAWNEPKAGPITLVKMLFDSDDMLLAKRAREEKDVLILPGEIYNFPGYFRIGLGREDTPKALIRFEEFVVESLVAR
tara:strand:+ start:2890 stop:4014 length:1125 start_codon:yes stop_codon:yes gene_type:complete